MEGRREEGKEGGEMGGREERVREGGENKGRRGGRGEVKESVGEEGKEERSECGRQVAVNEGRVFVCVCMCVCGWNQGECRRLPLSHYILILQIIHTQ